MKKSLVALSALFATFVSGRALATGFTDLGEDLHPRERTEVDLHGAFRVRGELLNNLDLDRGPTTSGDPIFPVPEGDPSGQNLTYADMRLRTDLSIYTLGGGVAVKTRIDVLDNVPLGSTAQGIPSASNTQAPPGYGDAFRIKRAYGEVKLPFGVLALGRQGSHWGLGMLANGGDCADCDSGDAADRIALLSPILGHILAVAYDFTAIGPLVTRADGVRRLPITPGAAVHSFTVALLRWHDPLSISRRNKADKLTFDYGAYLSHRFQSQDVPAQYLPIAGASNVNASGAAVMHRGYHATAVDTWLRFIGADVRVELEAAALFATVDQASLVPGVLYNQPVTSHQYGAALESELGAATAIFAGGFDAGFASGDPAPGFGAFPKLGAPPPKAGDLDGAQGNPPSDTKVDNFRFHPDYRIDRILFREIIGTVTDAYYLRPHARLHLVRLATGTLTLQTAMIASWAVFAASTPGGKAPLGLELDPTLSWASRDGFGVALEYAVFLPGSGFDNPALHLNARTAQLFRARFTLAF